jgi:hypothetical protein
VLYAKSQTGASGLYDDSETCTYLMMSRAAVRRSLSFRPVGEELSITKERRLRIDHWYDQHRPQVHYQRYSQMGGGDFDDSMDPMTG